MMSVIVGLLAVCTVVTVAAGAVAVLCLLSGYTVGALVSAVALLLGLASGYLLLTV